MAAPALWTIDGRRQRPRFGTAVGLAAGAVSASGRSSGAKTAAGANTAAGPTRGMADKSRQELYDLARKAGIEGRFAMSKKELARALSR